MLRLSAFSILGVDALSGGNVRCPRAGWAHDSVNSPTDLVNMTSSSKSSPTVEHSPGGGGSMQSESGLERGESGMQSVASSPSQGGEEAMSSDAAGSVLYAGELLEEVRGTRVTCCVCFGYHARVCGARVTSDARCACGRTGMHVHRGVRVD